MLRLACVLCIALHNTHLRRYVYQTVGAGSWQEALSKLKQVDKRKLLERVGMQMKPQAKLYQILNAMRKIFVVEGNLQRKAAEDLQAYFERVKAQRQEKCRPLMDAIDGLFDSLAKDCACLKNSRWMAKQSTPYVKAVVFYKNHSKEFRAFLDDPRLVCHTNAVERQIRPITLIRKNTNFAQSKEGLETLCDVLTSFETARLNGIEDTVGWLKAIHHAVYTHCAARHIQNYIETSGDRSKLPLKKWEWNKLLENFDCTPFLPWNYAAK